LISVASRRSGQLANLIAAAKTRIERSGQLAAEAERRTLASWQALERSQRILDRIHEREYAEFERAQFQREQRVLERKLARQVRG
jgi:hypothetical protein